MTWGGGARRNLSHSFLGGGCEAATRWCRLWQRTGRVCFRKDITPRSGRVRCVASIWQQNFVYLVKLKNIYNKMKYACEGFCQQILPFPRNPIASPCNIAEGDQAHLGHHNPTYLGHHRQETYLEQPISTHSTDHISVRALSLEGTHFGHLPRRTTYLYGSAWGHGVWRAWGGHGPIRSPIHKTNTPSGLDMATWGLEDKGYGNMGPRLGGHSDMGCSESPIHETKTPLGLDLVGDMGGHGGMRHEGEHKDMATWGHGVYREVGACLTHKK